MQNIIKVALLCLTITVVSIKSQMLFAEESVKHLDLPDLTSMQEAKTVFAETTEELKTKQKFDASELHDIHIITYSLEKAIAYFAENTEGDQQTAAKEMAEVVELVHIGSENDRAAEAEVYLQEYFNLASKFSEALD